MWSRGDILPHRLTSNTVSKMASYTRDACGKFAKSKRGHRKARKSRIVIEHNYTTGSDKKDDDAIGINTPADLDLPTSVDKNGRKEGRRVVEFGVLLSKLRYCQKCRLGPVPLSYDNVIGELKKGLGGYLYVVCQNCDCQYVNRVPYGKTHHQQSTGMPCFAVNTKLGTGNWP